MNNYENFAKYYDEVMGDRSDYVHILNSLIENFIPNAKDILELGCGTGALINDLDRVERNCHGVDNSVAMLNESKKRISKVKFHLADMTNFNIKQKFDLIVCVYETINSLKNIRQWRSMFSCCTKHLKNNGLLIFDFFTIKRVNSFNYSKFTIKNLSGSILNLKIVSRSKFNKIIWRFEISSLVNNEEITKFELTGKTYPLTEIVDCLNNFIILNLSDFKNPLKPIQDSERLILVLKKVK